VLARQRARQTAGLLGYSAHDRTRIATAVSEIARNVITYARIGKAEFYIETVKNELVFSIRITDQGPGIQDLESILSGRYTSKSGLGIGIAGSSRLMEHFNIETKPGRGTTVHMAKPLPTGRKYSPDELQSIVKKLTRLRPVGAFEELRQQNQELVQLLDEVNRQKKELEALNRELDDTNRGITALYAEMQDTADKLRKAGELKSKFISYVSHEFRTPLNAVVSLSRLLLDRTDGQLTPEQERQVQLIKKSAVNLLEMVNDLLDIAKIEAGKIGVNPVGFEVSELFSTMRGIFRPVYKNPELELAFEETGHIPGIYNDFNKTSQVLRNLLVNALKFTERGSVTVTARYDERKKRVLFRVEDTGMGIPENLRDRIFEEYVQAAEAFDSNIRGTGLGLPLSRKLARIMGGDLVLEKSAPGEGSIFLFWIPVKFDDSANVV